MKTEQSTRQTEQKNGIWDIFKFGESYTSLILGIIVVVVATVILLTFVRGRNDTTKLSEANQQAAVVQTQQIEKNKVTPKVTQNVSNVDQIKPTEIPAKPTLKANNKIVVKPTESNNKQKIAINSLNNQTIPGTNYSVKAGDTLWNIAERKYKSGYNWVDIQNANKLANANLLQVGTKLTLPDVKAKISTVVEPNKPITQAKSAIESNKIAGNSYTIIKGDTLWDIAIRAYGDGFSWSKIANANKLSNPNIIHSGNKINIPRV